MVDFLADELETILAALLVAKLDDMMVVTMVSKSAALKVW